MKARSYSLPLTCILLILTFASVSGQKAEDFRYNGKPGSVNDPTVTEFQFNGYTNYWHDIRQDWVSYGNLFKTAIPDIEFTIAQSKRDIADDLQIPGLFMQEGFMTGIIGSDYKVLEQPTLKDIETGTGSGDLVVLTDPGSETGRKLLSFLPNDEWKTRLKSHQFNAADFIETDAFVLTKGKGSVFVIASKSSSDRQKLLSMIGTAKSVVGKYDLKRGWFGAATLLKSVTIAPGHPLEVIGKGMNEGNSWFTFSGYMDYLIKDELETWLSKLNYPVIADVGAYVSYVHDIQTQAFYGCSNYDGLQPQAMWTVESWLNFAKSRGGYTFRSVYDPASDIYHYDGYIASEGNKEQIDNENVPFITTTGYLEDDAVSSMVLFSPKGQPFSKDAMWNAIMNRREVGILGTGKMMGPALYRNTLELLLLDRIFLEEYFGDRISIDATLKGYQLNIDLDNTYNHPVSGDLEVILPPELDLTGSHTIHVNLPADASRTLTVELEPSLSAMGKTNPVAISYKWETSHKTTMTMLDLPPAVSVHQLLYGHAPTVAYPVSIHNFTREKTFPVKAEVIDASSAKTVYSETKECTAGTAEFADLNFDLKVPAGSYTVRVSALGAVNSSQLGVGKQEGSPKLTLVDLNNDGVNEYQMENDSVRVTLLTTGARVIEYYVKSRNENVLFKLWPEKPTDDKREFRRRGYYPYGGFEDFLGQASMETHKVYTAEVLKGEGDYLSIKMTADYFGNKLVKTFTLYGNTPLLEVRYAFDFISPEANVIAPVPILKLGKKHWTEDIFKVPEKNGLKEYHMRPEFYFGQVIFPQEGWDSGYDPFDDISFIGAFPVSRPNFLHMFQNLATNGDAHYDFNEFQPWVPIIQKTTSYFTYYLWAAGGKYENGLKELKARNLISSKK